jgi:hypothetical protein
VAQSSILLSVTNDVGLSTNQTILVLVTGYRPADGQTLDDFGLGWVTSGDVPWFGQSNVTHSGQLAAQSGVIGNLQQSLLQTTVTGPGRLSFWWKVSSELNFDWLEFSIGPGYTNSISGEIGWQQQVIPVPPGFQTLTWRYSKDRNTSTGADAGWLDQVAFEPGIWLELVGGPTNGQCALSLHGIPGRLYTVQVSTNLVGSGFATNWFPLQPTIVATNLSVPFQDTNSNSRMRFYRLHDAAAWFETPNRMANGAIRVVVHNPSGVHGELQGSANLLDWITLAPLAKELPIVTYTDTSASALPRRLYRAVLFP